MNQDLRNRLAAVVEALDPEFRGIGERDSMLLLDAGAVSALDLFGLIKDRSKAAEVRASACWFAGRLRLADATSALIGALEDEHLAVREAAAEALGRAGGSAAVQPLLRARIPRPRCGSGPRLPSVSWATRERSVISITFNAHLLT